MKFKMTAEISANELRNIPGKNIGLTPIYNEVAVARDLDWIDKHKDLILSGIACDFVWEKYCDDMVDETLMAKKKFFEQIRKRLGCECKTIRLAADSIKYCFVDKMSSQHKST